MKYKYCQAGDCMSTGLYYCKDCYEKLRLSIPQPERLRCNNSRDGCERDPSLHFCNDCHSGLIEERNKIILEEQRKVKEKDETICRMKKKIELLEWRIQLSSKQDGERESQKCFVKKKNEEKEERMKLQLAQAEEREAELKAVLEENEGKKAELQALLQEREQQMLVLWKQEEESVEKIEFLRKWQLEWGQKSGSPCEIVVRAGDGGSLRANRSVLVGKSEILYAMLNSDTMEGRIGHIDMKDLDTPALIAFVRFLHTAEVSAKDLKLHARSLFMAAHCYGVNLLRLICEDFLIKDVSLENVFSYLKVGHLCNSKEIEDASFKLISSQVPRLRLNEEWLDLSKKYPELSVNLSDYLLQKFKP